MMRENRDEIIVHRGHIQHYTLAQMELFAGLSVIMSCGQIPKIEDGLPKSGGELCSRWKGIFQFPDYIAQ